MGDEFDSSDGSGSGAITDDELSALYKKARGERLKLKDLAAAMAAMDTDESGRIELDEFQQWWADNGGDLEKRRQCALTVQAGDVQLLLVAKDAETKQRWVAAMRAVLRQRS